MKQQLLLAILLIAPLPIVAQRNGPGFRDYLVKVERVGMIKVNLNSHKDARTFRTNLRNAAKQGVNFAGHYVLAGWGCGTNCSQWAIIDGRNGRVYFPGEFAGVGFGFCDLPKNGMPRDTPKASDDAAGPLYFEKNSRLVVLTGYEGGGLDKPKAPCGDYVYEWTGTTLKRIILVPGKRIDTP